MAGIRREVPPTSVGILFEAAHLFNDKNSKKNSTEENTNPPIATEITTKRKENPGKEIQVKNKITKPVKGRKTGQTNYSDSEMDFFLNLLKEKLPIGADDWSMFVHDYLIEGKNMGYTREVMPLKRKFEALYKTTKPTGNPKMAPFVARAKQIKELMNQKEVIGYASLNDEVIEEETTNDKEKPFTPIIKGTSLYKDYSSMSTSDGRPKRKKQQPKEDDNSVFNDAITSLVGVAENIAKMGQPSDTNERIDNIEGKLEKMVDVVQKINDNMDEMKELIAKKLT